MDWPAVTLNGWPALVRMITIGNILKWERLRKKAFNDFDEKDTDDILAIGYAMLDQREVSFEAYKDAALNSNAGIVAGVIKDLNAEIRYISQFQDPQDEASDQDAKQTVTEMVGALLFAGMDGNFLLGRGLEDLSWLLQTFDVSVRRKLEADRFWAFIGLLPYIDKSKYPNASTFLPFEWEGKAQAETEITDEEKAMAAAFLHKRI